MKVRDVEAFHISGEGNVFLRDDYKNNVELPGLEACLYLYDMNIQTTWFNCNKEKPDVELHFSYDTLSEENKVIAKSLEKDGLLRIHKDNYDFIERYFRRFDFDKYYDLDDKDVLKSLIGEEYLGYYYDEESNRVWYNEELFQKHQAYLNSDKGKGTI